MIYLLVILASGDLSAQIPQWEKQLKSDPANTELLLKLGKACHDLGGEKEDKEAAKKAEKHLSKLLEIEPNNALAVLYYGSVLTMKAREKFAKVIELDLNAELAKKAKQQLEKIK